MQDDTANFDDQTVWDRLREQIARVGTGAKGVDAEAKMRKLAERARLLRTQARTGESAGPQVTFLAFTKAKKRYGILLEQVVEVQALEQFAAAPGAPAYIQGVVHWRGSILALVDLTRLFEVVETGLADLLAYIVVEAGGKRLAVAATHVEDIVSAPRERVLAAPELPRKIATEWVVGVHDDNRLILKMDEICRHLEQGAH